MTFVIFRLLSHRIPPQMCGRPHPESQRKSLLTSHYRGWKCQTLAFQTLSSAELGHVIWPQPIGCTALDSEPETTERVPQRFFSDEGSSSCSHHVQISRYHQQHGHLQASALVVSQASQGSEARAGLSRQLLCCPASSVLIHALSLSLWPSQRFRGLPNILSINPSSV